MGPSTLEGDMPRFLPLGAPYRSARFVATACLRSVPQADNLVDVWRRTLRSGKQSAARRGDDVRGGSFDGAAEAKACAVISGRSSRPLSHHF